MQISSTNRSHQTHRIHLLHVKPMRPMQPLPKGRFGRTPGRFGRTPHGNQAHTTDYQSHTDRTSVSVFHMGAHLCAPDRTSLAHRSHTGVRVDSHLAPFCPSFSNICAYCFPRWLAKMNIYPFGIETLNNGENKNIKCIS